MKKITIIFVFLASFFMIKTEATAKAKYKPLIVVGCGAWQPICSGDVEVGVWRECTNIFGVKRLEIVHYH